MCHTQAKLQKLSLTYECKHTLENEDACDIIVKLNLVDDLIYLTDECYTESELGNWGSSQTSLWKHHRGCCQKDCSWISFSASSAFFEIDAF